jgi:serine protease AprX
MKLSRRLVPVLGLALGLLATPTAASAEKASKLDQVLRAARRQGAVHRVIIQARPGSRPALQRVLQSHGDAIQAEHPSIEALTVDLHGEDLASLDADPSVVSVSSDAEIRSLGAQHRRGHFTRKWNPVEVLRETLGLKTVPFKGNGISVAVVDSGLDGTRDLLPNIAGFWDFTRGGIATRPGDEYGHGTHIAGLIASTGVESNEQYEGVAPAATLYGFRVLDDKGRGRVSDVVTALEFIVANKQSSAPDAFKIDIINLSIGHPIYEPASTDPLVRAVEKAVHAGIVVVTAAGNVGLDSEGDVGYSGITSPGNAPSAITVGAVDTNNTLSISDDEVAAFSSRGPTWFDGFAKPDLVAPGVGLTSDAPRFSSLFGRFPHLRQSSSGGGDFSKLSGTSMAAAVTSGVASLVLQASRAANQEAPALTPNALKAVLQYTAFQLKDSEGNAYDTLTQGTGEINAPGAIDMALAINTDMPIGSPWLRVTPPPVTLLGGAMNPWSQALTWDDNIVWGTDALSFNSAQWDDNIVWGTALGDDDNIVWGTAADIENIVWGTSATWASELVWKKRVIGSMAENENIVWGTADGLTEENIVWGTWDGDNIVWGTSDGDNIVWGTAGGDNIVWGTADGDNIVWGTADGDNIVWGTSDDNIVWGTLVDEANIVWGTLKSLLDDDNVVWQTVTRVGRY